jgi:hypothetical protein
MFERNQRHLRRFRRSLPRFAGATLAQTARTRPAAGAARQCSAEDYFGQAAPAMRPG